MLTRTRVALGASATIAVAGGTAAAADEPAPPPQLDAVTSREREVLTLIGGGLTNQEIADQLYISHATARTHVGHLFAKLMARDRAQLVITAYETGLVTPRPPHR